MWNWKNTCSIYRMRWMVFEQKGVLDQIKGAEEFFFTGLIQGILQQPCWIKHVMAKYNDAIMFYWIKCLKLIMSPMVWKFHGTRCVGTDWKPVPFDLMCPCRDTSDPRRCVEAIEALKRVNVSGPRPWEEGPERPLLRRVFRGSLRQHWFTRDFISINKRHKSHQRNAKKRQIRNKRCLYIKT